MSLFHPPSVSFAISRYKWNFAVAAVLGVAAISPLLPIEVSDVRAASQAFSATGASQSFTVPNGVTEIQVYVRGAGGGSPSYTTPGKGAYVRAVLSVTPGEVLDVRVGSQGAAGQYSSSFGGGGAAGGTVMWVAQGGGASDIRSGGSALSNRIVVAGGGGAAGSGGDGGNGGTPNGVDGLPSSTASYSGQGGFGATQSAGGASGAGRSDCGAANGGAGALGLGGGGGRAAWGNGWYGSGGGGGYYGGGGGGSGCNSGAGGGGSSWVDPSFSSNFSYALASSVTAGCIEITWPVGTAASTCLGAAAPTTTTSSTTTTTTTTTSTTTTTTTTSTTTSTTTTTLPPASTTIAPATTTIAPVTTTIATSTTSPISPLTSSVATSQTTTTIAGRTSQANVSTTVAPINTSSAPVNTSSAPVTTVLRTTTTSTTVPSLVNIEVPEAVDVDPGAAAALVDGESVEMTLSRSNNVVNISGAGITGSVSLLDTSGSIIPLDENGNLHIDGEASAVVTFEGVKAGSLLELWVFSDPQQLLKSKVGNDGKVRLEVPMPKDLPTGEHKFVASLTNYANSEVNVSVGFLAGDQGSSVSVSGVIFAVLGFGILFALAIPARRRLRRQAV